MGWSVIDVDACEPWQFAAAWRGWKHANTPSKGPGSPSDAEFRAAVARTVH